MFMMAHVNIAYMQVCTHYLHMADEYEILGNFLAYGVMIAIPVVGFLIYRKIRAPKLKV